MVLRHWLRNGKKVASKAASELKKIAKGVVFYWISTFGAKGIVFSLVFTKKS